MTQKLIAACLQINSTPNVEDNLVRLEPMILSARAQGAHLITLPENVDMMVKSSSLQDGHKWKEAEHPAIGFFSRLAKTTGAWILAGSLAIKTNHDKLLNRSYLFDPHGQVVARYDKIHLFDASLSASESYCESNYIQRGNQAVLAPTPWGKVGLTICYDVRFPHLYRALAKAGAHIITVPAAFAETTGKLHWHVLLRARAIETGCFIVAPGQCGHHDGNRQTYGHSLIVDPLGHIIAEAGLQPTILLAELDLHLVTKARQMLPCLEHDREFTLP